MKYLVTGGAGFIGSNVVEELVKRKQEVIVLDNFSTGRFKNIQPFMGVIKLIVGDIRNAADILNAMAGCDVIIHLAALPSVQRSIRFPVETFSVNVQGTINLFNCAKILKISKFIFASSSSVYGGIANQEESSPIHPLSPYAMQKAICEQYAQFYNIISLRLFNVFGKNQSPDNEYSAVIPNFIDRIKKGLNPIIYGNGKQSRDFTHVDNIVFAIMQSIEFNRSGIFNIGCGESHTLLELVKLINKDAKIDFKSKRPGDVCYSCADIEKARRMLNYKPIIKFQKGIKKLL